MGMRVIQTRRTGRAQLKKDQWSHCQRSSNSGNNVPAVVRKEEIKKAQDKAGMSLANLLGKGVRYLIVRFSTTHSLIVRD